MIKELELRDLFFFCFCNSISPLLPLLFSIYHENTDYQRSSPGIWEYGTLF